MTLMIGDSPCNPDRNEPDRLVYPNSTYLIYGFKDPNTALLNGRHAIFIDHAKAGPEGYFAPDDVHFEVAIRGMPLVCIISRNNLMHLDDSDNLVIEILSRHQ